ncbi:MAG: metallophosphoesterase family protein [Paludibacteraceae bacterium]|nr:metallophosphoesterase family protein [Paludibacteraceae bacterium]
MVKKIIHIADVHIPNDVVGGHYSELIERLSAAVANEVADNADDGIRIAIVGDVYHNKIKATNEAKDAFHALMNYMNMIGRTIVVAGNHDLLENNTDRMDSITPTFSINGVYPNITFADKALDYKSGYIIDDDVIWVLYSIFDHFSRPNIDGLKEKYPGKKIIGLYHGDLAGAVTDIGRMSDTGINPKDFKGCDCVMAGHIHRYQELRKNGVPIVYAGSPFQQNAGENISGHGFVVWDMETMKHKIVEINNPYKIYRFDIESYDDVKENTEKLINL